MTRRELIKNYPTEAQMAADICRQMMILEKNCIECSIRHQCLSDNINPIDVIKAYELLIDLSVTEIDILNCLGG